MEFEYSPRHSPGNAAHLLSPTHMHGSSIDGFASIREIRRSLSYSPSKPSRYVMVSPKSPNAPRSPNAPTSPSLLSRGQNADSSTETPKPRYAVKRNPPLRAATRRISPNSPLRRALSDNTNQANANSPRVTRRRSSEEDQENMAYTTSRKAPESQPAMLDKWLAPAKQEHASPMKSSPLKRSDGVMNLEAASMGSPRSVKRRSLGASLGSDFNIFDQGLDGANSDSADSAEEKEAKATRSSGFAPSFGTPAHQSPQRRASNLRRTTLQQRAGSGRTRLFSDAAKESSLNQKLGRAGSRMSLDGALPMRSFDIESPFKRANPSDPPVVFARPAQKQYQSAPKAHPLSQALTPSSSSSSMADDPSSRQQTAVPNFSKPHALMLPPANSRSLPVGSIRPTQASQASQSSQESFETPDGPRMTEALPRKAFTTGLMSKRVSNIEAHGGDLYGSMAMPDTPSKKAHFNMPPMNLQGSAFNPVGQQVHEFGSPSTPFGMRSTKISPQAFGKGVNIFGTRVGQPQLTRRGSFIADDIDNSPTHRLESQSSNDDLPPTPTKSTSTNGRPDSSKGKSNSLRSTLFGRRTSLAPDTFASPAANEQQPEDVDSKSAFLFDMPSASAEQDVETSVDGESTPSITLTGCDTPTPTPTHGRSRSLDYNQLGGSPSPLAKRSQRSLPALHHPRANIRAKRPHRAVLSPTQEFEDVEKSSPHTPQDYFAPPDPSSLSISAADRPRTSMGSSNNIFAPATPTGPRDNGFSSGFGGQTSSFFANDVDTSLTERFGQIASLGMGEFSQVYKVSKPHAHGPAKQGTPGRPDRAWAVKKSRKPYTGNRDRQRKMREVEILKSLRGHEHVAEFVDVWEAKNHLYIQTDFYENGNLKDFLWQHGAKGRLDDFRIWKVLLELSQGLKSIHDADIIHLDVKPANVFVDWEGVLKIGDFGLASSWPAPKHLDGEGDREYIGPEVLAGRFDKPADIFALGMIMLEIAGNVTLPDNGASWQRLRAGDMSDLPSLSWSSEGSLLRDESGEIVNDPSDASLCPSQADEDGLAFLRPGAPKIPRNDELVTPPNFMVDRSDPQALDRVVQWMISPIPEERPTVDQLLACGGVLWVEHRRRAGATIWEGTWGPADDVLCHGEDVEMMDI